LRKSFLLISLRLLTESLFLQTGCIQMCSMGICCTADSWVICFQFISHFGTVNIWDSKHISAKSQAACAFLY